MREEIKKAVKEHKIIAIVRGVEKEKLVPFAEAAYEGGIRLLEITFDAKGVVTDEETAENIRMLREHFGDRMYIGAGTVLTEEQVELVAKAGGQYIISPDANEAVIKKTRELGLVSMPGAFTPTEIAMANRAGADFVKLFPAGELGTSYIKAIKAPLSNVDILAVGGVDLSNMKDFLKVGVCGFGIGSNLSKKELIAANDYEGITALAREFVKEVQ